MDEQLKARLRRLGVVKGVRNLKPAPPPKVDHLSLLIPDHTVDGGLRPLPRLLPGIQLEEKAVGACYVLDKVYPITHQHGEDKLGDLLELAPGEAAVYLDDSRFRDLDFRDFVFLDTETTGLAGAGTIAFMVGAAFFEGDVLITRQYFLRDHGDEPAMLLLLDELLAGKGGLVTFNGRSFDLPMLDGRYLMNRMPGRVRDLPHLDLLPPARRLWRNRLGSCALGSLEQTLLGVRRTHADVPGYLIPSLYHRYLRTGDGREMARVFYHNEIDLLSMVTMAARMARLLTQPASAHPLDQFSLGKWQAGLGLTAAAEQNLRRAAAGDLPLYRYHRALYELGWLLKRSGRRAEAVPFWQQIASTSFEDVTAHVELAKFYEWHEPDLGKAIQWTEQALKLAGDGLIRDELQHRLARLQGKQSR
ncbi:MAG: ribonuclease H-like domain-containing protein [Anaerolineae bacterium]